MKALPHGCCGVGAPAASAQLSETGEFGQVCRMNREVAPVDAYIMKWLVCSVERTLLLQSCKVSWGLLYLHWNKPLFHETSVHMASGFGSPPPPGKGDTIMKATLWYPHRLTCVTSHIYHMEMFSASGWQCLSVAVAACNWSPPDKHTRGYHKH